MRTIVKLTDEAGQDFYMEWSSIVDAPVTYGLSLEEFKAHYREEYGARGMCELDGRLARVEAKGTSAYYYKSAADAIAFNRAGLKEALLTEQEIIHWFCHRKESPKDST